MCKWSGEASLRPLWGFRSQEESRLSPLEHCPTRPTRHSPPQFMPHINLHPPLIHNQTPSIHKASSACIIYVSYVSRTRLYNICQQTITSQNEYWGWQHNDSSFTSWDRFFSSFILIHFYRTRVRSLAMLVSNWLTDWLTDSCLVYLIDVILAFEDGNSNLVEVVTVADIDDEDRVGNSLLQIRELTFCW